MTTVLFIGDPHFQVSNITEVDIFLAKISELAVEKKPDIIVIGGDLLHTHERLHTIALNKAYELVDRMRNIAKTYVLVGNHDMCNNQQFLSSNHWMNGMKEWNDTIIVDYVVCDTIKAEKFIFSPYVYPGRFEEALNTLSDDWKDASCIFAHQEFAGCKMGAIISVDGDKWPIEYPFVVSGHIHSRQIPQENIYYSGSAMQHAFGESEKNIIAYLTFSDKKYTCEEIDLQMPRKKIVYMNVEDVDEYKIPDTEDKIKVTVSGNYEQFKALKKTKKYKDIVEKGVKVVFKPKKLIEKENKSSSTETNFDSVLRKIVLDKKDTCLLQAYELVVNSTEIETDDVIFL